MWLSLNQRMAGQSHQNGTQCRRVESSKENQLPKKGGVDAGQTKSIGAHCMLGNESFLSCRCTQVYAEEAPLASQYYSRS